MTDYTNQVVADKYRVIEKIGQGGMGTVYRAEHTALGKPVAIKFLHAHFAQSEEFVERFHREAKASIQINHRNIIDVIDLGLSPAGEPYFVMEHLRGESLYELLKEQGRLRLEQAWTIIEPVLSALNAAHKQGIVHRDLKPRNIFLVPDDQRRPVVKLIDFGVSRFLESDPGEQLTHTGAMLGTPAYMSPEQARGQSRLIDARTDLWAAAVILFEMLTGERPFTGQNNNELLINIATTAPRRAAEVHPEVHPEVDAVLGRALARDPDDRFQNADDLARALRQSLMRITLADGDTGKLSILLNQPALGDLGEFSEPSLQRYTGNFAPTSRRPRAAILLLAVALVALAGVAAYLFWSPNTPLAQPSVSAPIVEQEPTAPTPESVPTPEPPLAVKPNAPEAHTVEDPLVEPPAAPKKKRRRTKRRRSTTKKDTDQKMRKGTGGALFTNDWE